MVTKELKQIELENRLHWSHLIQQDYLIKDVNNIVYDYLRDNIMFSSIYGNDINNLKKMENHGATRGHFHSDNSFLPKQILFVILCNNFQLKIFETSIWIRDNQIWAIYTSNGTIIPPVTPPLIYEKKLCTLKYNSGKYDLYINTKYTLSFSEIHDLYFITIDMLENLVIY